MVAWSRSAPLVAGALLFAALALTGCGGSKHASTVQTATVASITNPRDQWGTTWLCRPGLANDPCASDLAATVVDAGGATHIEHAAPAKDPAVDCFYVYPTISGEKTINADLSFGFREREVASAQASRFSQVCNVYAPVYRQITLSALEHPRQITFADALVAYRSVVSAFHDYLAHFNHGRGIVFIGHSQGATILIRLLQREVDKSPALRGRVVSALLLGGNVTVPKGKVVGGDFAHLPACTASTQTGCVVAYSSFMSTPLGDSQFGRTTSDAGVNLLAPGKRARNLQILCVNPAAPGGGTAPLDPYIPTLVVAFTGSTLHLTTPWAAFPGDYTAHCESAGNATWLQVSAASARPESRAVLQRMQQPILGLHLLDVNVALGNLVHLVENQVAHYRR